MFNSFGLLKDWLDEKYAHLYYKVRFIPLSTDYVSKKVNELGSKYITSSGFYSDWNEKATYYNFSLFDISSGMRVYSNNSTLSKKISNFQIKEKYSNDYKQIIR